MHGPTNSNRGRTRTHAAVAPSLSTNGPINIPNSSHYPRRVWNPLRLFNSKKHLIRPRYKRSNCFRCHKKRSRSIRRSSSLSNCSSSRRHTRYSESFDVVSIGKDRRSPSPCLQYEHATLVAIDKCSTIVYSDLYFKHGLSLNARLLAHGSLTDSQTGVLYQKNKFRYSLKNYDKLFKINCDSSSCYKFVNNYMPLYLSDDIKTKNFSALLIDLTVTYIDRIVITHRDFKSKCYEKNNKNEFSYSDYKPMIRLQSGEIFEEYFLDKSVEECFARVKGSSVEYYEKRQHFYSRSSTPESLYRRSPSPLSRVNSIRRTPSFAKYPHRRSPTPQSLRRTPSIQRRPNPNPMPLTQSMLNILHLEKTDLANKSQDVVDGILMRRQQIIDQIRNGCYAYDISKLDLERSSENFIDPMMLEPLLTTHHDVFGGTEREKRIEQQYIARVMVCGSFVFFILHLITFLILYFI